MYKWNVTYNDFYGEYAQFTIKARDKGEAIEKAINKVKKMLFLNDRNLNHYRITRRLEG